MYVYTYIYTYIHIYIYIYTYTYAHLFPYSASGPSVRVLLLAAGLPEEPVPVSIHYTNRQVLLVVLHYNIHI